MNNVALLRRRASRKPRVPASPCPLDPLEELERTTGVRAAGEAPESTRNNGPKQESAIPSAV